MFTCLPVCRILSEVAVRYIEQYRFAYLYQIFELRIEAPANVRATFYKMASYKCSGEFVELIVLPLMPPARTVLAMTPRMFSIPLTLPHQSLAPRQQHDRRAQYLLHP